MTKRTKNIVWFGMLVVLLLPFIQLMFPFSKSKKLKGAKKLAPNVEFTWKGFFEGDYQEKKEKYLKDSIGFRNDMIRVSNQIAFSFFDELRTFNVVEGDSGYYYEQYYIHEYNGTNFVGDDSLMNTVDRLEKFKSQLDSLGKKVLIVIAPGKGSFYPEYFPHNYSREEGKQRNYLSFKKFIDQTNIDVIDFSSYFLSQKEKSPYPLMTQTGIHWSRYAEYLAADSIISFVERTYGYDLPNILLDTIKVEDPSKRDIDLEGALNILFPLERDQVGVPYFHFEERSKQDSIKPIVIADSFFWGMYNFGLTKSSFYDGKFWFYSKSIYPDSFKKPLKVKDINIWEEIDQSDMIIFMTTEANLYEFPFGFFKLLNNDQQ